MFGTDANDAWIPNTANFQSGHTFQTPDRICFYYCFTSHLHCEQHHKTRTLPLTSPSCKRDASLINNVCCSLSPYIVLNGNGLFCCWGWGSVCLGTTRNEVRGNAALSRPVLHVPNALMKGCATLDGLMKKSAGMYRTQVVRCAWAVSCKRQEYYCCATHLKFPYKIPELLLVVIDRWNSQTLTDWRL